MEYYLLDNLVRLVPVANLHSALDGRVMLSVNVLEDAILVGQGRKEPGR
jgi:hypothetical protein